MADASSPPAPDRAQPEHPINGGSHPSIRTRARTQLAEMLKVGAKRLGNLDEALAKTETSHLTLGEVWSSVSTSRAGARARAALEMLDRAPGRAAAALASRTRAPVQAVAHQLIELENRLESKTGPQAKAGPDVRP